MLVTAAVTASRGLIGRVRKYNVGMSADVPRRGEDDGPRATAVTFRSVVEERPGQRLRELFDLWWPAYRRWFLRDGEQERSSYAGCLRALRTHVPELVPAYEGLVELVGGGDLEARFLSLWDPPPFLAACSLAAWTRDGNPSLLRSYDYAPALCETTLLTTTIATRRTMAMSDCLWGALDGVNEDGLAVALAFGGRRQVGRGFAVTLLLRYMLEQCADVQQALEAVAAVPVNLSYNIALVDASGQAALVRVAPDRAPIVEHGGVCAGNRQGATEWPEHAAMTGTERREAVLADALADPTMTVDRLEQVFLSEPVQRDPAEHTWGTVYTARYDTRERSVRLLWPDDVWAVRMADAENGQRLRDTRVLMPPLLQREREVPHTPQVIFA
jgi:predicted choloylglycine hydrolase